LPNPNRTHDARPMPCDETTVAADVKVQYVWDIRYIDAPVLRWRDADGNSETGDGGLEETLYYCNDANMNVTALVEPDGDVVERVVYDPYGKAKFYDGSWANPSDTSAYANEILYCGYRFDPETGLYHVRYRYYHLTLGRWMAREPMGYVDEMSLYQYVASNPVRYFDPFGMAASAGLDGATADVRDRVARWQKNGLTPKTETRETKYGTFHMGAIAGNYDNGQIGAGFVMDFVPNEETKKCCSEINIIQTMRYLQGGEPNYSADWHEDEEGNETEGLAAKGWSTSNGTYIERSHTVNTPFLAGTKNTGGVTGRAGVDGQPLFWEDMPVGTPDPTPGSPPSSMTLVACAICAKGNWAGLVFGCYRYGVQFTPKPNREKGSTSATEPIGPQFSESTPPDVTGAVNAWNEKAPAGGPKIKIKP